MSNRGVGDGIVEEVHVYIHRRSSNQISDAAHDNAALYGQVVAETGCVDGLEDDVMRNLCIGGVVGVALGDKSAVELLKVH